MERAELEAAFARTGAAAWGAVETARLPLSPAAAERMEALCPSPRTVFVAAWPYFTGETAGNLSVYARGRDYHKVLRERLEALCRTLREAWPGRTFVPGVDASPVPEREAAWRSGLGIRGKNGLFILPPYGSYVFLSTILTDLPCPVPPGEEAPECVSCGACEAACPGGALQEGGFDPERCLSALTQKRGELTRGEAALLESHPYIWGCDVCQTVCPYNRTAKVAPLPEFLEGYRASLTEEELEGLSGRAFRERFGSYAFAWRGAAVLRRNLSLKGDHAPDHSEQHE